MVPGAHGLTWPRKRDSTLWTHLSSPGWSIMEQETAIIIADANPLRGTHHHRPFDKFSRHNIYHARGEDVLGARNATNKHLRAAHPTMMISKPMKGTLV
jgi:hypothetical protein